MLNEISGFFCNILKAPTTNFDAAAPFHVAVHSANLKLILSILIGHGQKLLVHQGVGSWELAEQLYRLAEKFHLDGHLPWFSKICCMWAIKKPWEALFFACNLPMAEVDIIRAAIAEGIPTLSEKDILDSGFFLQASGPSGAMWNKESLLDPMNLSMSFGIRMGHRGLLAYNLTFSGLATKTANWGQLAKDFIRNIQAMEAVLKAIVVSRYLRFRMIKFD